MEKYRIKLESGRIVGPLNFKEVVELIYKSAVSGSEQVQYFPVGEWFDFTAFPELVKVLESEIRELDEETFIANIDNLDLTKSKILSREEASEELKEFEFEHVDPLSGIILGDLTASEIGTKLNQNKEEDNSEKTVVRNAPKVEELDKTKINVDYQKYLNELKQAEKEKKKKVENKEKPAPSTPEETVYDYENDATQFMSIEDIVPELEEAVVIEQEYKAREKKEKSRAKKKKDSQKKVEGDEKVAPGRLRRLVVLSLVALLVVYGLIPEEGPSSKQTLQEIKLVPVNIEFPGRYDIPSSAKAKQLYQAGMKEFNTFKFVSMVKASEYFKTSLMNKFDDNMAMHRLIFTYSRILPNSDNFIEDANSIFKLVLLSKSKVLQDPFFAASVCYFYLQVDKVSAAISIFDKYMSLKDSKPSVELFAVHLLSLTRAGKFNLARSVFNRLNRLEKKSHFVYEALYYYHKTLGQLNEKIKLIKEVKESYPESVYFDLEAGLIFADSNKLKDLKRIIYKVNNNNVEGSKIYYAKYLTLKGLYNALSNNVPAAVADFEKSLTLNRNLNLIEKLSILKKSGNEKTDQLITNSKAIKEVKIAENALSNEEYNLAFKHALNASNLAPNLIEAKLLLADLQLKRGYIEDAIVQLKSLFDKNPAAIMVAFKLIDAYIEAYQFRNANDLLNAAVNMPGGKVHNFYAAKAKYSEFRGNFNSSVGWLQRAVNANPIDDEVIYKLASLYVKAYKFKQAKKILNRAMDLDPSKVKYKILYAKIIYEVETSQEAIGYLYDVLRDFPDNPSILSEIGIYYYRSGQIKQYQEVKKQLLDLPRKTASLYRFLIESARLDDDVTQIIEFQERLIEIDPGDLKTRMSLATRYIDLEKYKKAKDELEQVNSRLKTYPKLNYSFARLYLLVDDLDKAKEMAFKEIKENPSVDETYVLLGDIFKREENYTEANKYYVKAMQLNSKNAEAILGVAFIAFKGQQFELALDQYERVIKIDPNKVEVYKLLGDAYRRLGQSQLAVKYYQDFLARSPNSKYKSTIQNYINNTQ